MLPCYNLFLQRQSLGAQEHEGRPAARMQRFHLLLRCHVPMSLLPLQQVPGADTNPQSSMIQPPKSLKLRDRKLLPVPSQLLPITDVQANLGDDVSSVPGSCHKGRITIKQAVIFFFAAGASCLSFVKKNATSTLVGVVQWLEHQSAHWRVLGSILGQWHVLGS